MFELVETPRQIDTVARLARKIWLRHFTPLMGRETVEHILERLQSAYAVREQIRQGYHYYLIQPEDHDSPVGYVAYCEEKESSRVLLSKLYILKAHRGRGFARQALAFVEERTRAAGLGDIVLTVYPGNSDAIAAYERMGFEHTGTIHRQIGEFEIDDVFMTKSVK